MNLVIDIAVPSGLGFTLQVLAPLRAFHFNPITEFPLPAPRGNLLPPSLTLICGLHANSTIYLPSKTPEGLIVIFPCPK